MKTSIIAMWIVFIDLGIIFLLGDSSNITLYLFFSFAMLLLLEFGKITAFISCAILFSISGSDKFVMDNFGLTNLDSILIILAFSLILFQKRQLLLSKYNLSILLFIFFFLVTYSLLGSINSNASEVFYFLKVCLINLTIFFLSLIILNRDGREVFLKISLYFCLLISLIGIHEWILNSSVLNISDYFYRSVGLVGNSNLQGQLIVVTAIPLFVLIFNKGISFYLGLFYFIIISFSLILTQSRGSILLFFILLILALLLNRNKIEVNIRPIILFFVLTFSTVIYYLVTSNSVYLDRVLEGGGNSYSNNRIGALIEGLKGFYSDLFGVGIGNSSSNYLNLSSHNFYIHVISETGLFIVPIFLIMLGTLIYIFLKVTKIAAKKNEFFISNYLILTILLFGFFTHNILYHAHYYFLLPIIGTELLLIRKIKENE